MSDSMLEKLGSIERRFEKLTLSLGSPELIADRNAYRDTTRERAELEPLVECFRAYKKTLEEIEDSEEILATADDEELRELARSELSSLRTDEASLKEKLLLLLVPKDPNDSKNIILEIRAGTGGDEAALFAGDLFGMYVRFAEARRWKVEILSSSESSVGGYKEIIARIVGKGPYSAFKYERGVHRVQRVPETETQGRIHTSTVTVAVLPEAEEVEVDIQDKDIRIDVFRASGPGGQCVNTTDSAVRITHLPSNLVVTCQDEKSQIKNKAKALMVLRARLLAAKEEAQANERRDSRRSQIGTGERSEKIRTYNFPQSRVTDHRIGLTLYKLDSILMGDLDCLVDPLTAHFRAEALREAPEKETDGSGAIQDD